MRPLLCCLAFLALVACPPSTQPPEDAGEELVDAGEIDAGLEDAGVPVDAGVPDAGFGSVAIEQWCQSKAVALCARQERCLSLAPEHLEACLERHISQCDQAAFQNAVASGRLQYLPEQAGDCLDAYAQGSCTEEPAQCQGIFQGLVPPDGGCLLEEECDSTGYCYTYQNTCPFVCRPYRVLGESCDGYTTLCEPEVGSCQTNDAGVRQCAPAKIENEPCDSYLDCREDLVCSNGVCLPRYATKGEPCGVEGPYPLCRQEYFCRQDPAPPGGEAAPGTCQPRAGLGGACTGPGSCLPNLRCSAAYQTGVCITKGAEGDVCTFSGDCQDELFCLDRTSRCTLLPADGGDCTARGSSYQCAPGFFCDFSSTDQYTCEARLADGKACTYSDSCQSGICNYGLREDGGYGAACIPSCAERWDAGS